MTGWSAAVASQTTTPSGAVSTIIRQTSVDQLFTLLCLSSSAIQFQSRSRRASLQPLLRALPLRPGLQLLRAPAATPVEPHQAQARGRRGLRPQVIQQLHHGCALVAY